MNESLSSIDPETYRDFCRDVYTAVSDVCFEYSNFGLSESDIISAVEEFKDGFFDSEYDDDNLSESYDLYILKGDKEKKIKSSKKITAMKKMIDDFVANPQKLDDMGATELFLLDGDKEKNNELFIFGDYGNGWEVVHDNIPSGRTTEYSDNLLNRVFYSLVSTASLPNFNSKADPELRDNIIKTKKGQYLDDTADAGYEFEGDDAIIGVELTSDLESQRKLQREWVKQVADHFGLDLKTIGKDRYRIVLKGEAKHFNNWDTYIED